MRGRGEDEETEGSKRKNAMAAKVPFFGMFRYAGRTDFALMAVGTAAAMVNGMSEPLMTVVFSAVIETFGSSAEICFWTATFQNLTFFILEAILGTKTK
jgi:ATP-binding cassette subfamily B (MDR/TAP) protein 1